MFNPQISLMRGVYAQGGDIILETGYLRNTGQNQAVIGPMTVHAPGIHALRFGNSASPAGNLPVTNRL
jgi:hypothetical protein